MNKYILIISLFLIKIAVAEQYDDRYDDINVGEILSNKRLLTSYLKCLLDKGRCTPEGQELKGKLKNLTLKKFVTYNHITTLDTSRGSTKMNEIKLVLTP